MKWRQKQDDIDLKLKERVAEGKEDIKELFPQFDKYPETVQKALLSMEFNLGRDKLKKTFPKFNEAVRKKDWQKASEECHIHNIGVLRNEWNRRMFEMGIEEESNKNINNEE